jgi:hypothetical protein
MRIVHVKRKSLTDQVRAQRERTAHAAPRANRSVAQAELVSPRPVAAAVRQASPFE